MDGITPLGIFYVAERRVALADWSGLEVVKFFMLSLAEHEICLTHKG